MSSRTDWDSVLADGILAFLEHKRALGKRYRSAEDFLRLLDRFISTRRITDIVDITPAVIEAFLASRSHAPRVLNARISLLRRFFDWLVLQGHLSASPVQAQKQRNHKSKQPFIFCPDQIRKLLDAAAQLPPHPRLMHRGETYRLAFALMYGLGLRVGEVARLYRRDADLGRRILTIRETKFSKSRLVPFGPKLGDTLYAYIQLREGVCHDLGPNDPLLSFHPDKRRPIYRKSISRGFHELIPVLGLTVPPGFQYPRAHHLRHSFAVATLLRWYQQGINPADRLIYLSTFMGHVDPSSTAVYLTITAELLQQANLRFERFAAPILQEASL